MTVTTLITIWATATTLVAGYAAWRVTRLEHDLTALDYDDLDDCISHHPSNWRKNHDDDDDNEGFI